MGTVRRVASVLALIALVSVFALRPLLANPAVVPALDGGLSDPRTLFVLPLVLVALLVAGLRINTLLDDDGAGTQYQPVEKNSWAEDEQRTERPGNTAFLSGQGGARDRDFEIEEQPPDAELQGHLEHLEAELGDDETVRHDLETLEEVVEETEDEQNLPARCPYEHCGAAWRERGIVGINTGNYELLDDGTTVLCLACERTVSLE
jgi:hypothetical protein